MDIILASASPRRKAILENHGYKLQVIPSNYDEKICGLIYSDLIIENCAYQKALDVKKQINSNNTLIVSADTVVVSNGIILGKPKDNEDAFKMLNELSNYTHFVATSVCLIFAEQVLKGCEKTYVTFRELSKDDILKYINTKKPFDKAGSYGIQDDNFDFAIKINGNLDNVIGFPMALFNKMLNEIN